MEYKGNVYRVRTDRLGNAEIVRLHDGANAYLQGDDAPELTNQLDELDKVTYPCGPFKDYESHLDAILDAYEPVIR